MGRFLSADVSASGSGSPQRLNRYSYAHNNPLNVTDPSGWCASDDSECYALVDTVGGVFGYVPDGLAAWSTAQLSALLGWINRGVSFTSTNDQGTTGGLWTAGNLTDVVGALNGVANFLGSATNTLLGLGRGLTFNKLVAGGAGQEGGIAYQQKGVINLFLTNASSDLGYVTAIHELGHIVDWNMNPDAGGFAYTDAWMSAGGWSRTCILLWCWTSQNPDKVQFNISDYAGNEPREDFAESFAFLVDKDRFIKARDQQNWHLRTQLDPSRESALRAAIEAYQ